MEGIGLYNRLLELPLFLGLNESDLETIVERTKLGFQKYHKGQTIVREGDMCCSTYLLQAGRLEVTTCSDDHSYEIKEVMTAVWIATTLYQNSCGVGAMQLHHNRQGGNTATGRLLQHFQD